MTRNEIKARMVQRINDTLEAELEDMNLEDLVTEDMIHDFLWEKDFGMEHVKAYIDDHEDDLVSEMLEDIYSEIDQDDLEMPW